MSKVHYVNFESQFLDSYKAFARAQFGPMAYQAEESFLTWLYWENPLGACWAEDFPIAVTDEGTVVACVHTMKLPWCVGGEIRTVAAAHNLMVAPAYRTGIGLTILMSNLKARRNLLVPGIVAPLDYMYRRLGSQEVKSVWYRKVLRPLKGMVQFSLKKIFKRNTRPRYFDKEFARANGNEGQIVLETAPNDELIHQLVIALNQHYQEHTAPYWNCSLLKWRFFHTHGPRHLLVYVAECQPINNFLIVSLGPRNGLIVGRIVAAVATSVQNLSKLVNQCERAIKRNGGSVLLTYCADPGLEAKFSKLGWHQIPNAPSTFIYHENRTERFESCAFMGFAGDLGFEAIPVAA